MPGLALIQLHDKDTKGVDAFTYQPDPHDFMAVQAVVMHNSLHADPRWLALLRQLGMAPEQLAAANK